MLLTVMCKINLSAPTLVYNNLILYYYKLYNRDINTFIYNYIPR